MGNAHLDERLADVAVTKPLVESDCGRSCVQNHAGAGGLASNRFGTLDQGRADALALAVGSDDQLTHSHGLLVDRRYHDAADQLVGEIGGQVACLRVGQRTAAFLQPEGEAGEVAAVAAQRVARQAVFQAIARGKEPGGVRLVDIVEDPTPGKRVHDPSHPLADADGYVTHSNVSVVEEMVNMISASRSYQNNVEVMNTARQLMLKTLRMGE